VMLEYVQKSSLKRCLPVPMTFRVFVERCEHDRKDHFDVITDKVAKVLVVPEIECSLGHLDLKLVDFK
jgi:hypothetical protein